MHYYHHHHHTVNLNLSYLAYFKVFPDISTHLKRYFYKRSALGESWGNFLYIIRQLSEHMVRKKIGKDFFFLPHQDASK